MNQNQLKTDLKNLTQDQLVRFVESLGQPSFRGRQILAWIYKPGITDFTQMTDLAKEFRAVLAESATMSRFDDSMVECSRDGAVKFAFRLEDNQVIESVLIPEEDRNTLCVSSQVGCAMGCTFLPDRDHGVPTQSDDGGDRQPGVRRSGLDTRQ